MSIVIVTKESSWESNHLKYRDLLEQNHPVVSRWKRSHVHHKQTTETICSVLKAHGKTFEITNVFNAKIINDIKPSLVITIGGDGTLLATSHYIDGKTPVLGVNSDPETSVGFFCGTQASTFDSHLEKFFNKTIDNIALTRMRVTKNGIIGFNRVLNDVLFCHSNPATTSSYILEKRIYQSLVFSEIQKSSGFWIGPIAGSSGARRSAGFQPPGLLEEQYIQLCVRELYYKPGSSPGCREIVINPGGSIHAISKMENGAMYIDGDHKVIPVGLGDRIVFEKSNEKLLILGKTNI